MQQHYKATTDEIYWLAKAQWSRNSWKLRDYSSQMVDQMICWTLNTSTLDECWMLSFYDKTLAKYELKTQFQPTVVNDAVLQQSLAKMNSFLWVSRLTNFHQPWHKLTGENTKHNTGVNTHTRTDTWIRQTIAGEKPHHFMKDDLCD